MDRSLKGLCDELSIRVTMPGLALDVPLKKTETLGEYATIEDYQGAQVYLLFIKDSTGVTAKGEKNVAGVVRVTLNVARHGSQSFHRKVLYSVRVSGAGLSHRFLLDVNAAALEELARASFVLPESITWEEVGFERA